MRILVWKRGCLAGLELATEPANQQHLTEAAGGSGTAFAALVREHQSMVFSIALHFLGDATLAEDIGQDVFLELHRNLKSIESTAHLNFWLRRVTSRKCIDHVRKARIRPRVGLEDAPEPSVPGRFSDPLMSRQLRQVVAALPERVRMMIVLRYQEEMEPSEIAETLQVPVGTVKSTLHRGLELLRNKMERVSKKGLV